MSDVSKSKGGKARAKRLTQEERSAIAKKAAEARWTGDIPKALCGSWDRPLRIANIEIECYVLEDGTRVLTQAGFLEALGRHRKAHVRYSEDRIPAIIQGKGIRPFVSDEILEKTRPIVFRTPTGSRAYGFKAELLPAVCEVYLKAKDANVLPKNQEHVAKQAEILVRGLAHLGIIALVDEATGYQEIRARDDLQRILEAFIAKELQPWVKTFPDDYYREIFRLRGLSYPDDPVKRPKYFGILTNDIVYERLAPMVLNELKKVVSRSDSGRPRNRYFQHLTSNMGYPKLREHLGSAVAIMKLSADWNDFYDKLNHIHPRYETNLMLPLQYDSHEEDSGKGL